MKEELLTTALIIALKKAGVIKAKQILNLALKLEGRKPSSFGDLKDQVSELEPTLEYPDEKSWNYALQSLEESASLNISPIPIFDDRYPKYLRAIDNAPPILYLRGNHECLKRLPGVAVVGSRKITKNGEKIAERISRFIVEQGWIVVSGLALGVDAAAHAGSLSVPGEGNTIAVLAHGLEKAKPVSNAKLADEIIERGGAWVSEHEVGIPAKPPHFVARNRIQLGLSVGSIIVEAEPNSGSITQAKFCLKQNRPLFAVVPQDSSNSLNLLSSGTQMLVDELGAYPIRSKQDYPALVERFSLQHSLMDSL